MYCYNCMDEIKKGNFCPKCGKKGAADNIPHHLAAGTLLHGKFVVGNAIGEGGFGITYIGKDTVLDKKVAIKEYFPSGNANRNSGVSNEITVTMGGKRDFFERGKANFLEEARKLAKLSADEGVVDVLDCFQENNTAYIVMEYLNGITLREYVDRNGLFRADALFRLMLPIMTSLEKMHEQGIIHRDISPENIMFLNSGAMKLMDFGSARYFTNENSDMSVILKEGYAPEEQYRKNGNQGAWTDVYGLCATIYRCITGIVPDSSLDRLNRDELKRPSQIGFKISPALENVLMHGLAVHSGDRCPNMTELKLETNRTLSGAQFDIDRTAPASDMYKTRFADEPAAVNNGGNSYIDANSYGDAYNNRNSYGGASAQNGGKPKKSKAVPITIAISAAAVLIAAAVAVIMIMSASSSSGKSNRSEVKTEAVTTAETTAEPTTEQPTTEQPTTAQPTTAETVEMPDIVGKKISTAIQALNDLDIEYTIQYQESEQYKDGIVCGQSPNAHSSIGLGTKAIVFVAGSSSEDAASSNSSSSSSSSSSGSTTAASGDYLFANTDSAYLSSSQVEALSDSELQLAINEIYARHGYIFNDADVSEYFNSKSWYTGKYTKDEFSSKVTFNDYEEKNLRVLENERDSR